MRGRIVGAATALSLLATPALAGEPLVDATLKLCIETRAEAKVAFAAAETDGWTMPADCHLPRTDDASIGWLQGLNSNPCSLVREKVTGAGKMVLVLKEEYPDWSGGPFRNRRCSVTLAGADIDAVQKAATEALRAEPWPGGEGMTVWLWAEGSAGNTMLGKLNEKAMLAQLDKGPLYGLQLYWGQPTFAYSAIERIKP